MTYKGFSTLRRIIDKKIHHLLKCVIIGTDKNITDDFSKELKNLCIKYKISHFFRDDPQIPFTDYSIVISWRWIIKFPQNTKAIILHDSLLPRYRGFAPLVNMLLNKEPIIGVTAIFAENEYDSGDIIDQKGVDISYPIKISQAIKKITPLYEDIVVNILNKIAYNEPLNAVPQDVNDASFSIWRDELDYIIDWNLSADAILNSIYILSDPYKGAITSINEGQKIRILDAETVNDVKIELRHVGKVLRIENDLPIVICGKGLLKITQAIDNTTGFSILPLKKFRTRFY
jgi:methionyl-tRNA formyltransferase